MKFETLILSVLAVTLFTACSEQQQQDSAAPMQEEQAQASTKAATNTAENANTPASIEEAAKQIDEDDLMAHVNTLASDEFEGRAPSTPGGKKTVGYIEGQFKRLGLLPPFTDADGAKSYRQQVDLIESEVTNSPSLTINYDDGSSDVLPYKESSIVWSTRVSESAAIEKSDLVFVGYGVVAPEYNWNDYEGVDMTGKTAVILVNDPGFRAEDDSLFKGNTMTYYGRWTYKYQEAARQGAAGAIVVHETKAAGYPWEVVSGSWSGAQYMLFTEDGNAGNVAVEGWVTMQAAEKMFEKSGMNYQEMVLAAGKPGFKAVPLSANANAALNSTTKQTTSYNVAGLVEGSQRPDEVFIYTAHWDHMGIKEAGDDPDEDFIFNGAQDNATGTAAIIETAQAFKALPQAPQRSVMFLAVTAEESGLIGSKQYAENPPIPMSKHVAGINMDGMSTAGATDDIVVVGYGNSQMDEYLKVEADKQGRVLVQEPTPEKGYFYRSDHFNLAKKGVPMLYAEAGSQVRGKPEGYGTQEAEKYISERYHKPGDEVHAEWDNGGIMQDINANFRIGVAISDSNDWPQWSDGNEFKAIREASQAQ